MKNKSIFIITFFLFLTAVIGAIMHHKWHTKKIEQELNQFISNAYKVERSVIEKIPIYEDFSNKKKEQTLRTYLLFDHMKIARSIGLSPVTEEDDISKHIEQGNLISIDTTPETLHYFYNVRKNFRYLTANGAWGLSLVTERFQKNISKRAKVPPIKIAVSSAIRSINYQNNLRNRNHNASFISSHCYGVSFDIFYDDYFVTLTKDTEERIIDQKTMGKMERRYGFILGHALRRQFKSVLMKTLLELQDEGYLYAILEKRQRCYHVTIIKDKNK